MSDQNNENMILEPHDAGVTLLDRGGCPICGCVEHKVHIPFPDIPVVQCDECDFIYSGKVLSDKDIASYYAGKFGSERHRQGQIINAQINGWVLGQLLDLSKVERMLDVGAGYGYLPVEMHRQFGIEPVGVELSRQEAEYATSNLGVNVIHAPLSESGEEKGTFDLATSFEVIEHTPDPVGFIREMAEYVKLGGHLVIGTDNFGNRSAQALGAGFAKWIPHSHISHFAPATLELAAKRAGGLVAVGRMSYTPWEIALRRCRNGMFRISQTPAEAFCLQNVLQSEMNENYRLFALRNRVNKEWARLTSRNHLEGQIMYLLLEKE